MKHLGRLLFLALSAFLFTAYSSLAPAPTPSPTATLPPTATATRTPTPEPTVTPTITPTPTPLTYTLDEALEIVRLDGELVDFPIPPDEQKQMAQQLLDLGIGVIVGEEGFAQAQLVIAIREDAAGRDHLVFFVGPEGSWMRGVGQTFWPTPGEDRGLAFFRPDGTVEVIPVKAEAPEGVPYAEAYEEFQQECGETTFDELHAAVYNHGIDVHKWRVLYGENSVFSVRTAQDCEIEFPGVWLTSSGESATFSPLYQTSIAYFTSDGKLRVIDVLPHWWVEQQAAGEDNE